MGDADYVAKIEWRAKAGEDVGAEGCDDLGGSAVMREENALYPGPDGAHLSEERQVFLYSAFGTGDDEAEGFRAQLLESVGVPVGVLCGNIGGGECSADLAAYRDETSNNQDTAHSLLQVDEFNDSRRSLLQGV